MVSGQPLEVLSTGVANTGGGLDFLGAQLVFDNLQWRGSVEVHFKSSYWYTHQHQDDPAYDGVILHVVWEDDMEVVGPGGPLPTLCLAEFVSPEILARYTTKLTQPNLFIPCGDAVAQLPLFKWEQWITRLYIERLEQKIKPLMLRLKSNKNDWEALLFSMLAQNFGLNRNGAVFAVMADATPFRVVQKTSANLLQLEALFLGQVGLLSSTDREQDYVRQLQEEYLFLKHKHQLHPLVGAAVKFARLRPPNFPTLRLAQLARLYHEKNQLFQAVLSARRPADLDWIKNMSVSAYWQSHYTLTAGKKTTAKRPKKLSASFFDLLYINTFVPLRFAYQKRMGQENAPTALRWMEAIVAEKNKVIRGFAALGRPAKNALNSQALLHLKQHYCIPKRCLKCAVGHHLMTE
ncbi:MAG: DUF2851 family protein [Flavobacteriaceae bacterium]